MSTPERPFASYHLWSLVSPAEGQKRWHCQMRRGFTKARQHEPQVKAQLKNVNAPQRIGLLAQRGVYEFHYNPRLLEAANGVEQVAELLKLSESSEEVRQRVIQILKNYHSSPMLADKRILLLTRGDEGFPKAIAIEKEHYSFRLYAAMDCVFIESDISLKSMSHIRTLHILDFKTGKSPFDRRQALVYLVAARYLYPGYEVVASFYNLESNKKSDLIAISNYELDNVENELANIAQKHQQDMYKFNDKSQTFSIIFPPNPGYHCRFCPFKSICEFSSISVNQL
jgi:ATP-dependent helicase/DNAse subunit B